jgi:hypothetical protein
LLLLFIAKLGGDDKFAEDDEYGGLGGDDKAALIETKLSGTLSTSLSKSLAKASSIKSISEK